MGKLPGLVLAAWFCAGAVACYGTNHDSSPGVAGSGGNTDSDGSGSTGKGGSSGAAGSSPLPMAGAPSTGDGCLIGKTCECASGLLGSTQCVDDVETCDCSACPAAPVDAEPVFVGCGGDPFGTWGAAATDSTAAKRNFGTGLGTEATCPLANPALAASVFMLRLDDGGAGAIYFSGISGTGSILESCVESFASDCTDVGCARGACGTCECDSTPAVISSDAIAWVRTDSTLTLTIGVEELTFEYCVQGDTLTLLATDGSDLVFTLKNGYPHGTPVACTLREVDECASTGCHVGVCSGAGGTCAEGTDETSCTNRSGCTWDPTQCAGTIVACELGNYGTAPGCEFTESAVCSGTPSPCDTKGDINACDDTPGCYWGAEVGCNGTAGECAEVPLDTCKSVVGCDITPG
ncbi:MAG TPA: hypothetical protein VM686_29170 [Polyangiaceae bacterium]|nr:hypothetical protein [Polyangiaceae bacterium]